MSITEVLDSIGKTVIYHRVCKKPVEALITKVTSRNFYGKLRHSVSLSYPHTSDSVSYRRYNKTAVTDLDKLSRKAEIPAKVDQKEDAYMR